MKKSDFEMLSNEELQTVLRSSESYGIEEIQCVQEILKERLTGGRKKVQHNETVADAEFPSVTIPQSGWTVADIKEIKRDVKIIKGCAIFFVVLILLGAILCAIGWGQLVKELASTI